MWKRFRNIFDFVYIYIDMICRFIVAQIFKFYGKDY